MQHASLFEYQQQCFASDIAFFELLKSIAEIRKYESMLSSFELEQIKVGARVLNGLIARHTAKNLA